MHKPHILTAVWKRPEITRVCFEGIKRLGFDATAAISEAEMIPLCEEYGISYIMTPNKPLGKKWNAGMLKALDSQWDYVMILGSDDIVSDSLIDLYKPYMGKYYMFGVDTVYFYHDGVITKFNAYQSLQKMSVGAGRMIHRKLVEMAMPLWGKENRGLDGACLRKIRSFGIDEKVIEAGKAVVLDIKSKVNINAFDSFKGEQVSSDILHCFSEKEQMLLKRV